MNSYRSLKVPKLRQNLPWSTQGKKKINAMCRCELKTKGK